MIARLWRWPVGAVQAVVYTAVGAGVLAVGAAEETVCEWFNG